MFLTVIMLVGVVGKSNTGKSTFFKASTLTDVEISNRIFTTIEANEGVGFVKDKCPEKELNVTCDPQHGYCKEGNRFIPIRMLDVAGLVPGAHEGKGLGNQFLDDLRQADVLIHIVDASGSTNEKGEPCSPGEYDPCRDVRFLEEEIDCWFSSILSKSWRKFARSAELQSKNEDKEIANRFSGLGVNLGMVKKARRKLKLDKKISEWTEEEIDKFAKQLRLVSKPIVIAANKMDLPKAQQNIEKLKKEFPELEIIPCSAESELALREASKGGLIKYIPGERNFEILKESKLNQRQEKALNFVENLLEKWNTTGVQGCLNTAVFDELEQIVVYPVEDANKLSDQKGNVLPDSLLLPKGSTALDLAYAIHTDIGESFVKAINAKTKQVIGKEQPLKNNDVIEIVSKK